MNTQRISEIIKPESVLDIGANVGGFGEIVENTWPDAGYLAIEGNPACAPMLEASGRQFVIALLSNSEKIVEFYTRKEAPTCTGASYMLEQTDFYKPGNIAIQPYLTTTLDSITGGRAFDLVKIDTQGSELDVMRGGEKTISGAKAVILEVSHIEYNKGAPMEAEVDAYMKSVGFMHSENMGDIVHPLTRTHIQTDRIYYR